MGSESPAKPSPTTAPNEIPAALVERQRLSRASSSRQRRPGSDEFNQQWELCLYQAEGTAQSQLLEHIVVEHILFSTECCIRRNFLQILPSLLVFILFLSSVHLPSMFDAFFILCLRWALPLFPLSQSFPVWGWSQGLGALMEAFLGKIPPLEIPPRANQWDQWDSESAPALSCTPMRDQVHPPRSSLEIPGTGSTRKKKTAARKT